ncbi:MAG: hypothetical protein U1F67_01200 [Rubrivivax sp.]
MLETQQAARYRRSCWRIERGLTPHVAFSSDAALAELRRKAAEEVIRVLGGAAPLQPCNSRRAGAERRRDRGNHIRVIGSSARRPCHRRGLLHVEQLVV